MYKIDDKIRVLQNGAKGTVVHAEDGYVCVELDNGVEMEFEDLDLIQGEAEFIAYIEPFMPYSPLVPFYPMFIMLLGAFAISVAPTSILQE